MSADSVCQTLVSITADEITHSINGLSSSCLKLGSISVRINSVPGRTRSFLTPCVVISFMREL